MTTFHDFFLRRLIRRVGWMMFGVIVLTALHCALEMVCGVQLFPVPPVQR